MELDGEEAEESFFPLLPYMPLALPQLLLLSAERVAAVVAVPPLNFFFCKGEHDSLGVSG